MKRIQEQQIIAKLKTSKLVLVSGPRLSGKEELIEQILETVHISYLVMNLGNKTERQTIEKLSEKELITLLSDYALVVVHEGQYAPNLQTLIELVLSDRVACRILLNCSFKPLLDELLLEALDLAGLHIRMYPPTFYELASHFGLAQEESLLERRLIYGNYPQVVLGTETIETILATMLSDILVTELGVSHRINKKEELMSVLQTIAFFIGEPVSYNEIALRCQIDNETAERYVLLLEKAYILIRIPSFSTNKRYELKKSQMIYFVDTGLRNLFINNFNPPKLRMDMDGLWKNWLISERIKWNALNNKNASYWFWRSHTKQSIDFLEENTNMEGEKIVIAYKATWEKKKKLKFPAMFALYYPDIPTHTLNRSTYWGFLSKKQT